MAYIFNQQDVKDFARFLNAKTTEKETEGGLELNFEICPYCKGGNSGRKNTFSVNLNKGTFSCFYSTCNHQGHFVELARDFNYKLNFGNNESVIYKSLPQRKDIISTEQAIHYLEGRGINRKITEMYQITTKKDNRNVLVFPFRDDKGKLVFIKYRNIGNITKGTSKEWCEKNAKPILFGMDKCVGDNRIIITEGQIDTLSLIESGIPNAVSVPNGANGFTWIEHVWDWISKFKEMIVFGDLEDGKMSLLDTLQKRMPMLVKAVRFEDYLGEKDANDILRKYGKDALRTAVNNAKIIPVRHVKKLSEVEPIDLTSMKKIFTGLPEIDMVIGGMYLGQLILLTGKRGKGKSTWLSQMLVEAVDQGYTCFAYSGELKDLAFRYWLDLQAAGNSYVSERLDELGVVRYSVKHDIAKRISSWYDEKLYLYDNEIIDDDEMESLLIAIEMTIQRYGVKFVCLDNLMTAMDSAPGDKYYMAQSVFVKKLKVIAMRWNVVIVLVAHTKKIAKGENFENDDVSGSADITNRVDTVMVYERIEDENRNCDSKLHITKNRLLGKLAQGDKAIELFFSERTKRISTVRSGQKHYGWELGKGSIEPDKMKIEFDIPF